MRPDWPQLALRPARAYVEDANPVRFEDLDRAAIRFDEIALGPLCWDSSGLKLLLNPDRETEWRLVDDDEVVVLACEVEPGESRAERGPSGVRAMPPDETGEKPDPGQKRRDQPGLG